MSTAPAGDTEGFDAILPKGDSHCQQFFQGRE
jgi:hypothetical protein